MGNLRIQFDEKEALRYFGARPGDDQAKVTVDRAFLQLRNEVQPRNILQQWSCRVIQGTEREKGRVILENGTEFVSSGLARHLEGCDALLLFGATLGAGWIRPCAGSASGALRKGRRPRRWPLP